MSSPVEDEGGDGIALIDAGQWTVMYAGRPYPLRRVHKCATCRSPHRMAIEQMLLQQFPFRRISQEVAQLDNQGFPVPTYDSIRVHLSNRHSPLIVIQMRALKEESARELGDAYAREIPGYVNHRAALRMVVQEGVKALEQGQVSIGVGDMVAAARMLEDIETRSESGSHDVDAMRDALVAFLDVSAQFIPVEMRRAWSEALATHPVLKALQEPQVIEGERDE